MAKVKIDSHGPYVRGGGWLFRPLFPVHCIDAEQNDKTSLKEGDKVKVYHHGGTKLGSVTPENGDKETWYSHGCYIKNGGGHEDSEDLWKPGNWRWPGDPVPVGGPPLSDLGITVATVKRV